MGLDGEWCFIFEEHDPSGVDEFLKQSGVLLTPAHLLPILLLPVSLRYDTMTIVWICLTLITGLVALLVVLICKKR